MAGELNLDGRGLTREDEMLARVVLDLGLAKAGDVQHAVDFVGSLRPAGDARSLAEVMQEAGSLHPRFVKVVMKAVSSRMAAQKRRTSRLVLQQGAPARPRQVASPGEVRRSYQPPAAHGEARGGPDVPAREVGTPRSGPDVPAREVGTPRSGPDVPAQPPARKTTGIVIPEAFKYKQAPKGEGFSSRSKTEIASAWAAHRRGEPPPPPRRPTREPSAPAGARPQHAGPLASGSAGARQGAGPAAPASAGPSRPERPPRRPTMSPLSRLGGRSGSAPASPPQAPPQAPPQTPTEPRQVASPGAPPLIPDVLTGKAVVPGARGGPAPRPLYPEALTGRPIAPKGNRPAAASPIRKVPKGKRKPLPKRKRFASSGVTQSINIDDLREELGIGGGPKPEEKAEAKPEPATSEDKLKEVALHAFVKRAVRSTLHQQCLDVVLRKRLTQVDAPRLAEEAMCRERDARRVLDDWKSGGIAIQEGESHGAMQYRFSPARADLEVIREFMVLWNEPDWHKTLLGWIIAEEAQGTR